MASVSARATIGVRHAGAQGQRGVSPSPVPPQHWPRPPSRVAILPTVREIAFSHGFPLGNATPAHQAAGDNTNSDWWEFENRPNSPCYEPSGSAIEHYKRYTRDIALLANLGFNRSEERRVGKES